MNKDVIYIDVDDDITEIIGKVKSSSEKIVALVPPKRVGVLQSVVNLRILNHAATGAKKHLVLISNDQALTALAASIKIPVAKNLQSKPEVPTVPALKMDDGDDIIDGAALPVGEHAAAAGKLKGSDVSLDDIDIDGTKEADDYAQPPEKGKLPAKPNKTKKVPNFSRFRKRFLLIGGALLIIIAAFVWAQFIAAHATVVISANMHDEALSSSVQLAADQPTDASKGVLHAVMQREEKEMSLDFTATGEKEVGDKAQGSVTFATDSISNLGRTVPAGTTLTSQSGQTYVTTESATFSLTNSDGVTVGMTATDIGDDYNGATGSMSGTPSGVSAEVATSPSGGSQKTVKIVTQEDVQKASEQLVSQNEADMKDKLTGQFSKNTYVITGSYQATGTKAESSPKIGDEASDGKATLTTTMTYTMMGVDYSDLKQFITEAVETKLPKENAQRVYEAGEKEAKISDFTAGNKDKGPATATIDAHSQVGPDIDVDNIKRRVKGKQFGDIQSDIESISGVERVEVDMFPFWLKKVPNDLNRITVKFNVQDNAS